MSNGPRANLGRQNAQKDVTKGVNTPRPKANENSPVMKRLNAEQTQQMNAHIGKGRQKAHTRSETVLHQERAYMYAQMGQGPVRRGFNSAMTAMDPRNKLNRSRRNELSKEAQQYAAYQKRAYDKNTEATQLESTGTKLRIGAVAANVADNVGTGVALINPAAGVATKAVAKGATIGLGMAAAAAYDRSAAAYRKNVDESATGMQMLDSHISQAKADLATTRRNKTIASTAMTAGSMAGGFGVSAALEGAKAGVEFAAQTGRGAGKMAGSYLGQMGLENNEKRMKSEVVGLMRHQMGREVKPKLDRNSSWVNMPGPITDPTELKRQNGTRNLNPGIKDAATQRQQAVNKVTPGKGRAIVKP